MKKTDTILALDPGLRELGFAVLAGTKLVASGVRPLRLIPRHARLAEAQKLVRHWIRAYHPSALVLEATHPHSLPWLNDLDRFAAGVRRFGRQENIPVSMYAAQTVRKTIVGHGWATKRESAFAVACRYPALRVYLTQDRRWKERHWLNLFDAVALALHHQAITA